MQEEVVVWSLGAEDSDLAKTFQKVRQVLPRINKCSEEKLSAPRSNKCLERLALL